MIFRQLIDPASSTYTYRFGDETVHAIGTPGHTPGSTCYLWRDHLRDEAGW
jgi:glyoxylase-like metal-dependent hydrolase (beta-lactamase superfamily II)